MGIIFFKSLSVLFISVSISSAILDKKSIFSTVASSTVALMKINVRNTFANTSDMTLRPSATGNEMILNRCKKKMIPTMIDEL